ncbi:MAG: HU family DNA-binding protein, partial [Paludibacteraceae bacterium]
MTKVEFIKAVASEAGVTQDMAAKCYDAVFATIKEELAKGEKVAVAGFGYIETIPGASGGARYVPDISPEKARLFQEELCAQLQEEGRVLGGGFLYTSDIMYNPSTVQGMARIFAKKF